MVERWRTRCCTDLEQRLVSIQQIPGLAGQKQRALFTGMLDNRKVAVIRCGKHFEKKMDDGDSCQRFGIGTLVATAKSPFTADIFGFCPPSLQTKGYIVMEHMKAENNPGLWEDIKSTEEFLALAFSVIGAVKELHRHGRLLTDYGANQYMLSGDAFRLKTHDVDCLDEGRVNGEQACQLA
jgi:hypothetical protein